MPNKIGSTDKKKKLGTVVFRVVLVLIIYSIVNAYGGGFFWRNADEVPNSKDASKDDSGLVYGDKFCKISSLPDHSGVIKYYKYNILDGKFYKFLVSPFILPIVNQIPMECE